MHINTPCVEDRVGCTSGVVYRRYAPGVQSAARYRGLECLDLGAGERVPDRIATLRGIESASLRFGKESGGDLGGTHTQGIPASSVEIGVLSRAAIESDKAVGPVLIGDETCELRN